MLVASLTASTVEPALYCSGYYNGTNIVGPYNRPMNTYEYPGYSGYICKNGQICIEDPVNNPNFGFLNYDTIFSSFLSVYTFTSLELWTSLMYQNMDADSMAVALFYCLGASWLPLSSSTCYMVRYLQRDKCLTFP